MTKQDFERESLYWLKKQYLRYPSMAQEDAVKFVFQAMLGVGHLLSSRTEAADRIAREMAGLSAGPEEPLYEILSPSWVRLNLRPAVEKRIQPSVIAGMMLCSGSPAQFSRKDVFDFCVKLEKAGEMPGARTVDPERILDGAWLPSHSPGYREKHRPAYRVVSADWIPCMEAVSAISAGQTDGSRLLVTVDGPCASGKTTLARKLAEAFEAPVVHTDDFVIPHAQKTGERLAVPGGNCDAKRLAEEVAAPWKSGGPVTYRKYDCGADRLLPPEELPDSRILILEGSYCNLPEIRRFADVRLFVSAPLKEREKRLRRRESEQSLKMFHDRWIPLEDRYFAVFGLPDPGCIKIASGGAQSLGADDYSAAQAL